VQFLLHSRTVDILRELKLSACKPDPISITTTSISTSFTTSQVRPIGMNKKRAVAFIDQEEPRKRKSKEKQLIQTTQSESDNPGPSINLSIVENTCRYFSENCTYSKVTQKSTYIASFPTPDESRMFYISNTKPPNQNSKNNSGSTTAVSLGQYLRDRSKESITCMPQFRLALKLARAVLQYHSTPWLGEEWTISELTLMPSTDSTIEDFPLYLNKKLLSHTHMRTAYTSEPNDITMNEGAKTSLSEAQRAGIYNTTLFCLGMALVEIGHWKGISELYDCEIDRSIVDTVKRMAGGTAQLGALYDTIVQECLNCGATMGSDLGKSDLQKKVYEGVVSPLELIIEKLDGLSL
jgi:hypothetical protein